MERVAKIRNPISEARKKSEGRNSKSEKNPTAGTRLVGPNCTIAPRISGFGFASDFDIRISDFH